MYPLPHPDCHSKEEVEKLARASALANFVRAESEFLSIYERNEEIEEIRVAEIEEEKYERHISNEIIKLRKTKFDLKTLFMLVVIFLIFGYLFQAMEGSNEQRKRQNHKTKKLIRQLKKKNLDQKKK